MELLRLVKRRSLFSEAVYLLLNIGLAVVLYLLVVNVQNIWLPLGLVLLSKWRVLAVRPRYWWANIVGNMVDIIVSLGYVIFLYAAENATVLQLIFLLLFIVWLLLVKPSSSRVMVGVQAISAVFSGTTSLAIIAYNSDPLVFVAGFWLVGYLAARHFLASYEFEQSKLLALSWGLIMAELGYIGYHWLFAYSISSTADFKLVQLSLIVTLLSFLVGRAISLQDENKKIRLKELIVPALFSIGIIAVLLIVFDNIDVVGSI